MDANGGGGAMEWLDLPGSLWDQEDHKVPLTSHSGIHWRSRAVRRQPHAVRQRAVGFCRGAGLSSWLSDRDDRNRWSCVSFPSKKRRNVGFFNGVSESLSPQDFESPPRRMPTAFPGFHQDPKKTAHTLAADTAEVIFDKIKDLLKQVPENVALGGSGAGVFRAEFATIRPNKVLCMQVVDWYMQKLASRRLDSSEVYAFPASFMTQLGSRETFEVDLRERIATCDVLLLPAYSAERRVWFIAVIYPQKRKISCYDPNGTSPSESCTYLLKVLQVRDKKRHHCPRQSPIPPWQLHYSEFPWSLANDPHDSGVLACKYAEYSIDRTWHQLDAGNIRYFRFQMMYNVLRDSLDVSASDVDLNAMLDFVCQQLTKHISRTSPPIRHHQPEKLLEHQGLPLYREEFDSLDGARWLNDAIIDIYLLMLTTRANERRKTDPTLPRVHAFSVGFWQVLQYGQKAEDLQGAVDNPFEYDILLVPVHVNNVHWCLAVVDVHQLRIDFYDPQWHHTQDDTSHACLVRNYLLGQMHLKQNRSIGEEQIQIKIMKNVPEQTNSYDCGVFICKYAQYVIARQTLTQSTFTQADMARFRRKMKQEILEQQLSSDP
ncbi:sentrin-specific protease 1-like [Tropilaelaps mercedesae]|uniref:Sentrin-specific protease 1-like n=1 Tax=Tropilaelaps mercedesae TaxID=418985 RepID=A0A1V9XLP7_9ACAR|nr:sentrin-specific protease 1-like [Tropilaelaps mercedesae]